jgi:hypothetical protein
MEPTIKTEELECLVCCEIPIKVTETDCCGAIICETCGPKLKTCPNRCLSEKTKLVLNVNKFVQRMVNHLPKKCTYCNEEFRRAELLDHQEACDKNK